MRLEKHAEKIAAALKPIAAGFAVVVAENTRNLLVILGEYGFVITDVCLKQWPFERVANDVTAAARDLVAGNVVRHPLIREHDALFAPKVSAGFDPA